MHRLRVYTAIVFVPFFFILVKYFHPIAFTSFLLVGILLAQYEYFRLHSHERMSVVSTIVAAVISIGFVFSFYHGHHASLAIGLIGMASVVSLGYLVTYIRGRVGRSAGPIIILFGVLYIGWMLGHLVLLRGLECGVALIFFVFFVTWASDITAYYVGSSFGRRKLAPTISPGKTIEGAVAGLVGSVIASLISKLLFMPALDLHHYLIVGLLLGVVGQAGDLFESRLKRHVGVKDSGTLLPGHGGMLDRADSLIFTAPVYYYYIVTFTDMSKGTCI